MRANPFADPKDPAPKATPRAKARGKARATKKASAKKAASRRKTTAKAKPNPVTAKSGEDNELFSEKELGFGIKVKGGYIALEFDKKVDELTFDKQQTTFLVDQLNAHKKLLS